MDRSRSISQHSAPHQLPTTRRRGKDGAMMLFRNSIYPPHSLPSSFLLFSPFAPSFLSPSSFLHFSAHKDCEVRRMRLLLLLSGSAMQCNAIAIRPSGWFKILQVTREVSQPQRSGQARQNPGAGSPRGRRGRRVTVSDMKVESSGCHFSAGP